MSDLTKFSDGASILQQVDVSDIFKNLALGIAEAQQKLDDNSIAQAIKLAETQINGVSLLELGFAPVFYAFQYADISASINLKMALKESLEFGFGLDLQIASNKGYTEDTHNFLSEDSYSETSEEYKTSRQVSFRAKEKKAVKINNKFVKQNESLAAKSRLEKFKYDIVHEAGVDQVYDEVQSRKLTNNQSRGVDVWMDGGFLRIEEGLHFGTTGVGVLKISDYSVDKTIDIDGTSGLTPDFDLQTDLVSSLTEAVNEPGVIGSPSTQLYGLSKTGDLYTYNGTNWIPLPSTIYFGYNSDKITYGENLKDGDGDSDNLTFAYPVGAANNENHNQHGLIHQILRLIRSNDPDASIKITGMTDPKGGDNPKNKSLAKRRAEKLRDHIFGSTAIVDVNIASITNAAGNSDLLKRYAKIELDSDYMIFIGGTVKKEATPEKTDTGANKFVYADDIATPNLPFESLNVKYGSLTLNISESTFSEVIDEAKLQITNHSYELSSEGSHYFLDDEAIVKLSMYTNESDEIAIEESSENGSEGTENSSSYIWSKSKNQKSVLSDATSKKSQDNSFALGASVDFRMSRQFEMSMEGNASMAARLVAVPAPQGFVVFLQNVYVNQTTEE
jgi:hypothetical protein